MLAIQAPAASALITPARRDSPRPAAMVRSASGPRPNTSLLPSGMPTTSPDRVATRTAAGLPGWCAIALLSAPMRTGVGSASLGLGVLTGGSRKPGMARGPRERLATGAGGEAQARPAGGASGHAEGGLSRDAGRGAGRERIRDSLPARSLGGNLQAQLTCLAPGAAPPVPAVRPGAVPPAPERPPRPAPLPGPPSLPYTP